MKVRIIGCHGGVSPKMRTTCFQINDSLFLDAGSLCDRFSPHELKSANHFFITHPHLDHVKDLAFLIDNTFAPDRETIHVYSTEEVIRALETHLFNDVLWPDFTKIPMDPKTGRVGLKYHLISDHQTINGINMKPIAVNHSVSAVGYVVTHEQTQVVFTGDTGPTEKIWTECRRLPNLKAIFTEISFPNRLGELAAISGHFTITQLVRDLKKLEDVQVPVYINHFKPQYAQELLEEFHKLAPKNFHLLQVDDSYEF
ncbi:MAG: 3',5'-cyclic-nucleotide phosphodiesterase [Bdellovibrionales bacterium]|nr:3',5'-cyclic-nucleotide phosphodiesterase [Bdellovibrionales bacterium]